MKRGVVVLAVLALVACQEHREPPPPPRVILADAPRVDAALYEDVLIATPPDAAIDAMEVDALDPQMARVLASPPCCCALASTEPEYEMQPKLLCEQDTHGRCVARAKCPAAGSIEEQIARWWQEALASAPTRDFVAELNPDPAVFTGLTCGRPYVVDVASPKDDCLRAALAATRPPAKLREGWGCKGFSGTDLAKQIATERAAAGDRLRCGNRSNVGVFVAVDTAGNITAYLVNTYATR